MPDASGFDVTFNMAPQVNLLNLYQGYNYGLGLPDVTVVGQTTGAVSGSLVWDASTNTASFVATRGVLAPDTYTVTLASRSDGWVSVAGNELLDGNDDLVPGGDYVQTFTVAASTPRC